MMVHVCIQLISTPSITGLSISGIIHNQATLNFDNMNTYDATGTQVCESRPDPY